MPNDENGFKATVLLKLENIESDIDEMKETLKELPCTDQSLQLEKVRGNFKTLVIVLVATGAIGGGTLGATILKMLTLGG